MVTLTRLLNRREITAIDKSMTKKPLAGSRFSTRKFVLRRHGSLAAPCPYAPVGVRVIYRTGSSQRLPKLKAGIRQ